MKNTFSLQDLFHDRVFRVPDYQRGYAWGERQVDEFLDDLELLGKSRRHYTGTVVLHRLPDAREVGDNEGTRYVEAQIVDGQQRLTTAVVLVSELSKALREFDDQRSLAEGIRKKYVATRDMLGQPLHKLTLNRNTRHYFTTNILPDSPTEGIAPPVASARRLLNAKNRISAYLSEFEGTAEDRRVRLIDLYDKLTTRLQFNLYEVEREAEVGVIFEVMNDRGIPLSELDKVKNYLLYAAATLDEHLGAPTELANSINGAWADILRRMMLADLGTPAFENQLLRSHWLINYNPQSRQWHGSRSLRSNFDLRHAEHRHLLRQLSDYVAGLRSCCAPYCDAVRPNRSQSFGEFSEKEKGQLRLWGSKLMRVGYTATFVPLLMAIRLRWPGDAGKYLEALKLCETVAFRTYRVGRYYSTYRQSSMINLAHQIMRGLEFSEVMTQIKSFYGGPGPRNAFEGFTDPGEIQRWYGRGSVNYLLYEYESHLARKSGGSPRIHWEQVDSVESIEHILPQHIGANEYWNDRFDPQTHEEIKHDLGNLTLTKGNSALGNRSYPEKKGSHETKRYCYVNSLLQVERELPVRWPDWTRESIEQRRECLLSWAKSRWRVEFD